MVRQRRFIPLLVALAVLAWMAQAPASMAGSAEQPALEQLTARVLVLRLTLHEATRRRMLEEEDYHPFFRVEGARGDGELGDVLRQLREANPFCLVDLVQVAEMPLSPGRPAALRQTWPGGARMDLTLEVLAEDPDKAFAEESKAEGRHLIPVHVVMRFRQPDPPGPRARAERARGSRCKRQYDQPSSRGRTLSNDLAIVPGWPLQARPRRAGAATARA